MKKFIKYGIIAGGVLILAGAGIVTVCLLLGADMGELNGHIRKRLHHLDGIVEKSSICALAPGEIGYDIECKNRIVEFSDFTVEGNRKKGAARGLLVMEPKAGPGAVFVQHMAAPQEGAGKRREKHGCETVV